MYRVDHSIDEVVLYRGCIFSCHVGCALSFTHKTRVYHFHYKKCFEQQCNRCDIIDLLELHEHVLADHGTNKFELTREESNIRNDDYNEVRAVRRGKRLTERDRD